jgi:hypothetical protein
MTHKAIKRFQIDGQIRDDSDIARLREQYVKLLVNQMRDEGYVQVLDLTPAFSIEYDKTKSTYKFLLTMHGVFYGKVRARELYGVANSREVPV